MELLECIRDDGYNHLQMMQIENYPVKGEIYLIRKRCQTSHGVGYTLDEIINPLMPNGEEPSFHSSRFKKVDDINVGTLFNEAKEKITT